MYRLRTSIASTVTRYQYHNTIASAACASFQCHSSACSSSAIKRISSAVLASARYSSSSSTTANLHRQPCIHLRKQPQYQSRRFFSSTPSEKKGTSAPSAAKSSASSSSSPSPPLPPSSPNDLLAYLQSIARRSLSSILALSRSTYHALVSRPRHMLALLLALIGGYAYGHHRLRSSAPPTTRHTLASYHAPTWATKDSPAKQELAQIIHILPCAIERMRQERENEPMEQEDLKTLGYERTLALDITPVQMMERLRLLLNDPAVLNVLANTTDISPSSLLSPLISLVCNPAIHPFISKYAAVCLNRMCLEPDGRLCKLIAAHSTPDLLVCLSVYSDFHAWNYLYLMQQHPGKVETAEGMRMLQQDETTTKADFDIPAYLQPYHAAFSASIPPDESTQAAALEESVTLNHNSSPVSDFLSQHLTPTPASTASSSIPTPSSLSFDTREFVSFLLALPPVHRSGQSGLLQHAFDTGVEQRERGVGIVQTAREMGKHVVQHGATMAAEYRSALASDDLSVLKDASESDAWHREDPRGDAQKPHQQQQQQQQPQSDPTLKDRLLTSAREAKQEILTTLTGLMSRTSGYRLGLAITRDRRAAARTEVAYHAFRAFASLSQDARTAGMIVENGGIDMLYRMYMQYPHELRVQIQVARAIANLLEHAHSRVGVVSGANAETDARFATYHAVARSGFLPMLVHWNQHALNYTDAAPSASTNSKQAKVLTHEQASSVVITPPAPITTQPSDPKQRDAQEKRLKQMKTAKHTSDELPTLPIPPPIVKTPKEIADAASTAPNPTKAASSTSSSSAVTPPLSSSSTSSETDPLRQPHHPESSASLRNKLQLQSARALINMRSVCSYKFLSVNTRDRLEYVVRHGGVSFPLLTDEVYQFYPLLDTLTPLSASKDDQKEMMSNAQKNSKSVKKIAHEKEKQNSDNSDAFSIASSLSPPIPPPSPQYDIVFLHGLMGNPLRTWRLHSMHDRTIGWIPTKEEEEKRRELEKEMKEGKRKRKKKVNATTASDASKQKDDPTMTPLARHLSNIVTSGPVPSLTPPAPRPPIPEHVDPVAETTNVFDELSLPLSTRASEEAEEAAIEEMRMQFDPSPAAPPVGTMVPRNDFGADQQQQQQSPLPPHAPIYASQHSLDFETLWPRDWLPSAFPNARIISIGYSSPLSIKTTGEVYSKSLEDRAKEMEEKMDLAGIGKDGRKVIWVVHSLGGLIVKKVLLNISHAQRHAEFRRNDASSVPHAQLLDNTIATAFYSTPHIGTWLPVISQEGLFSYVLLPSHELIDLQNQSKLRNMNEEFKSRIIERRDIKSLSMGEGIGTPIVHFSKATQRMINYKFVPIESSNPGFGSYLYFPTQNHLTICKPKTELDENYSALIGFLKETMKEEKEKGKEERGEAREHTQTQQ